ncbi:MAG TPA: ElyC/SanA/YdcF family protein, partial [Solirubrobacter sp.]
ETAPALRAMLEDAPTPGSPASWLRDHPRLTVICDRAAASRLRPRPQYASDSALVVLGHREPGRSSEHQISYESRARLRHARRLAGRRPFRAIVLTGYTSTGGLSEAEQMKSAWDEHAAPALLEVAGRNTAENASRSLPLLLALGDVRRVVVVTSAWHLRTPWFFAPYQRHGLDVSYRVSFVHGHWPRMLAQEFRGLRDARAQRAAAMAALRPPRT